MTTTTPPIAVVTGANSGIENTVAIHLAAQGMTVYGTVRSVDKAVKLNAMAADAGGEVKLVELDVADDDSVSAGLAQVLDDAERIDVLVNNAGRRWQRCGRGGDHRDLRRCDERQLLRCASLPQGRASRDAGAAGGHDRERDLCRRPLRGALAQAPYVASKWALEAASEELAQEVAAFGIRVAIIEPGITKSAIFAKNLDATDEGSDYQPHLRRMFQFFAAGHAHTTDPFDVGKVVHHAITTDAPVLRYPVSWGGPEILSRRPDITDEQWIALGAIADDDAYYRAFSDTFGLDITPAPT